MSVRVHVCMADVRGALVHGVHVCMDVSGCAWMSAEGARVHGHQYEWMWVGNVSVSPYKGCKFISGG